ncbi:uncharacterized protein LOC135101845 isoform X2 [Scylla paramamosain]|uniref:uncharacterized protein LOC135101845 isoform X2 n=1 Tax=Scylla paramamosain TaxID=85552 RepID=UPI003082D221
MEWTCFATQRIVARYRFLQNRLEDANSQNGDGLTSPQPKTPWCEARKQLAKLLNPEVRRQSSSRVVVVMGMVVMVVVVVVLPSVPRQLEFLFQVIHRG